MNSESLGSSPRTLLIADDQPSVLVTLEYVLAGEYSVLRAQNGRQALSLAQAQPVDGALVDLHMPGLSGVETCRQLRALATQTGRSWPVWLMSAALSSEARRVALEAGVYGFIAKPFPEDLLDQLAAGIAAHPVCPTLS